MARNSLTLLFATIFYCFVLVTEGRSVQQSKAAVQPVIDKNTSSIPDGDIEEYRFLTGAGGTTSGGGSSAAAINNFITQKQQILESLRPQGGLVQDTGPNIIVVNPGSTGTTTGTGTATATGTAGGTGGSNVPSVILPQIISAAAGGGRRRRRPTQRRNNSNGNQSQRQSPQIYVVRP